MKRRLRAITARLLNVYGIGRAAFGAGAMAAPGLAAEIFMGPKGRDVAPRTLMGNFGTRDVILGAGMLHAVRSGGPARPWLAAGFAADVLDTVVLLRGWKDLPAGKRAAGVGSAMPARPPSAPFCSPSAARLQGSHSPWGRQASTWSVPQGQSRAEVPVGLVKPPENHTCGFSRVRPRLVALS